MRYIGKISIKIFFWKLYEDFYSSAAKIIILYGTHTPVLANIKLYNDGTEVHIIYFIFSTPHGVYHGI